MIELKLFLALVSYYFVMFATPGPNNAMLTASGIKFGFKKTLPHLIGIPFGHTIQITLVCFGLGKIFQKYPAIQFYLKWVCFVYLLYLGWKIIGSFSSGEKDTGRPLKLYEAALFQFINPKAWVVALTAATAFFPNEESFIIGTIFVAITGLLHVENSPIASPNVSPRILAHNIASHVFINLTFSFKSLIIGK